MVIVSVMVTVTVTVLVTVTVMATVTVTVTVLVTVTVTYPANSVFSYSNLVYESIKSPNTLLCGIQYPYTTLYTI